MNPIHILALDTMIDVCPDRNKKIIIGMVFDMLMNLDIKRYANMTPGQRRMYISQYFSQF